MSSRVSLPLAVFGLCLVLLLQVSGKVIQKRAAADDIGEIQKIFEDIGGRQKVDLVIALDRSKSMSEEVFYLKVKKLTKAILQQYATLDLDYVRLAVITFAVNSTVEFDYITNPDSARTKCTMFYGEDNVWDSILYKRDLAETNIRAAFVDANRIFGQGKSNRPDVEKQVVLLITDGKYNDANDPIQESRQLKEALGVTIYGVGIGVWLEIGNVRILTSQESDVHLYADYDHWVEYVTESGNFTSYAKDYGVEWSRLYSTDCSLDCQDANANCYCDIDRGVQECLCKPGYFMNVTDGSCTACPANTYKSHPGNDEMCSACPPGTSGPEESTSKMSCACDSPPCTDPCDSNPCGTNEICVADTQVAHHCLCQPGWAGVSCEVNTNSCAVANPCLNEGHCVDGLGSGVLTCVCTKWGYTGRYCEIEEDECVPGICQNDGNCTDKVNNFECECSEGKVGRYCQDDLVVQPSTSPTSSGGSSTTPATTDPRSTQEPATGDPDQTFWIIIGASVGGGLLLLIIIIIVSVCVCRKKKQKDDNKEEVQKVARQFSGFWKKKTMRGNKWADDEENRAGTPSVPAAHRPDLLSDTASSMYASVENLKTDEYAEMPTETMTLRTGMESWQKYITELEDGGVIDRAIIVKTSGGDKCALTGAWMSDAEEIERLQALMETSDVNVPLRVQDHEFHIQDNDGTLASGQTIGSDQEPKLINIGRTKTYLVVAIAGQAGDDGKSHKEVQWIVDHISGEGY